MKDQISKLDQMNEIFLRRGIVTGKPVGMKTENPYPLPQFGNLAEFGILVLFPAWQKKQENYCAMDGSVYVEAPNYG